jgi:hypothetical protein
LCRIFGDPEVQLVVTGSVLLHGEMHPSLISTTYGATAPASRVRVRGRATVPARITTQIWWAEVGGLKSDQPESATRTKSHEAVPEGVCQA